MIRQLGCPTFFLTLSCADLQWKDIFSIIFKMTNKALSKEMIDNLNYFERCEMLNNHPVFVARHFQYRVEVFFFVMLIQGEILGKIQ